jgi:hypothetical protein
MNSKYIIIDVFSMEKGRCDIWLGPSIYV